MEGNLGTKPFSSELQTERCQKESGRNTTWKKMENSVWEPPPPQGRLKEKHRESSVRTDDPPLPTCMLGSLFTFSSHMENLL